MNIRRRALLTALAAALTVCASFGVAQETPVQNPPLPADTAMLVDRLIAAPTDDARRAIVDERSRDLSRAFQNALNARGQALRRAGRLDEAAAAQFAALAVAERLGDRRGVAMALINYSTLAGIRGDYPATVRALDEALAIGDAIKDEDVVASALTNLAIVYRRTGDYERAVATDRRSLAMAVAANDLARQGRVYNNLGAVYNDQGRFRDAIDAYEHAVAIRDRINDTDVATTLLNIGSLHASQGNSDLALSYYERALAKEPPGRPDRTRVAEVVGYMGVAYRESGRLDEARASFARALEICGQIGDQRGVARQTYNLASLARAQRLVDDALAGDRRSLAIREQMGDRPGSVESLVAIAQDLNELGRREEALTTIEQAVAIARDLKSNESLQAPLTTAGDIRRRAGDLAGAEAAYRQAIDAVEAVRSEVAGGAESRRRYLEEKLDMYRGLTVTLFEQRRVADGLAVIERARARALEDVLEGADLSVRSLTGQERDRQRALEQAVVAATAKRDAEQIRKARLALDEVRDAFDARYPVRRLARGDPQADPLALAGDLLADGKTAILEYVITADGVFVVVVTRDNGRPVAQAFRVAATIERIRAAAVVFSRKLSTRDLDFHQDARRLYDLLVKPAATSLAGRTRAIVVPDGPLWTIPFDALEPAPGRAVIDEMTVAYAPSIAVLHAMRARRGARSAGAAAPRLVVAADAVSDLPRIPDAARQAAALSAVYGAVASHVFVGAAATEPAVRSVSADAAVLHFATHGVVDNANPMYSFLQLTRADDSDAAHDGRLEAWEIATLRLNAVVAVLTACDTARGRISGEGVVGLAWSFFAAGTPATVVSLWQLDSASATSLTLDFHRRLHESLVQTKTDVAASLRAAALDIRRDPRYRHPFYWAGLVAVGDAF